MGRWLSAFCRLKITPATGPPRSFCHHIVNFCVAKKKKRVLSRTFCKKETFVIDLALIPTPAPLVTFQLNVLSSKKDMIEPDVCVWHLLGQIPARYADNKRWKKSLLCRSASAQTKGVLFRSLCRGLLIPVGKLSGLLPPPLWGSEVRVSHSAEGALQLFKEFGCKSSETLAAQTFARFKGNIYVYFLGICASQMPKIKSRHLPLFCHHGIWVRSCFLFKDKKKKNNFIRPIKGFWCDYCGK